MSKTTPQYPNRLAIFRQKLRLSQAQAAHLAGFRDRQKIARYERGERLPSLPNAVALAATYDVPIEQLYPAIFAEARAEAARRREAFTRQHTPYEPPPNTTPILALYPGTRKIGMAVFEALPSH